MPPRAPKVVKEEAHPDILDENYLKTLSRAQIQRLAKHNGIKANGKTEAMIAELLAKQPELTSEMLVAKPEVKVAKPAKHGVIKSGATGKGVRKSKPAPAEDAAEEAPIEVVPAEAEEAPVEVLPPRRGKRAAPTQPSRETKAPKRPRRGQPVAEIPEPQATLEEQEASVEAAPAQAERTQVPTGDDEDDEDEGERVEGETLFRLGGPPPTVQDILKAQKILTSLLAERTAMKKSLDETKSTMSYAMDTLESGSKFIDQMSFRRQIYERDIIEKMKAADKEVVEATNVDEEDDMYMPA